MPTITDVDLGLPEGWVGWRIGAAAEAEEVVRELDAPDVVTRARTQAVRELDAILAAEGRFGGAVWAPDPTDGPWGQLTVTLYAPAPGEAVTPQDLAARLARPRREPGSRVFDYSVAVGEAEAGPMVVQVEVRGEAGDGVITSSVAQTIFPVGGDELVRVVYTTGRPAVFERLAQESLTIGAWLTVEREG